MNYLSIVIYLIFLLFHLFLNVVLLNEFIFYFILISNLFHQIKSLDSLLLCFEIVSFIYLLVHFNSFFLLFDKLFNNADISEKDEEKIKDFFKEEYGDAIFERYRSEVGDNEFEY